MRHYIFAYFKIGSYGINNGVISSGDFYLGEKGLETILRISRYVYIDNGLTNKLLKKRIPIPIHSTC